MYTLTLARTTVSAVDKAVDAITETLDDAVRQRGKASLVVSGGTSPIPLFERLNLAPLPWEKIMVTLADERWVDPQHENSNERLVHIHLLKNRAEAACFIPLKNDGTTPRQGARLTEQALKVLPSSLDVVVLGMGMDGHTLSWFPDAPQLEQLLDDNNRNRCGEAISVSAAHPRLSLTFSWIRKARLIVLFLATEEKTRRFEDLMAEQSTLPACRLVSAADTNVLVIGVEKASTR